MLNRTESPLISFDSTVDDLVYDTELFNNGIPLYSITDASKSVCGIEIIFGGGKLEEIKNGSSYFATNLLKAGIKGHSSNYINNFFELRGAFIQFQNGLDYNSFSLYCLSGKLKETLEFFFRLFNEPTFPKEKLKQLAKKKEQELTINKQKSSYWSSKLLKESLFGTHPYGLLLNEIDIKSISSLDLKDHWSNFSKYNIRFITAVGNFDKTYLKSAIQSSFGKQNNNITSNIKKEKFSKLAIVKNKALKNSSQSSLKVGFHTIGMNHDNYSALSLGNTILGGYFGSRLMQSIREEKGLTYGIGSSIQHLKESSFVQISADVKFKSGDKVIELINIEIDKVCNNKIPHDELLKVKHYLIGEYKSNSQTIFDKINKIKFLKIQGLSNSYFSTHYQSILSQTSIAIQETLKDQFNINSFKTALVE